MQGLLRLPFFLSAFIGLGLTAETYEENARQVPARLAAFDQLSDVHKLFPTHQGFVALRMNGEGVEVKLRNFEGPGENQKDNYVALDTSRVSEFKEVVHNESASVAILNNGGLYAWGEKHGGGELNDFEKSLSYIHKIVATNQSFYALHQGGWIVRLAGQNVHEINNELMLRDMKFREMAVRFNEVAARTTDGKIVVIADRAEGGALNHLKTFSPGDEFVRKNYPEFFRDRIGQQAGPGSVERSIRSLYATIRLRADGRVFADPPDDAIANFQTLFNEQAQMISGVTDVQSAQEHIGMMLKDGTALVVYCRINEVPISDTTSKLAITAEARRVKDTIRIVTSGKHMYILKADRTLLRAF